MFRYLFILCLLFSVNLSFASFLDVTSDNEFYEAVQYLQDSKIVQGYSDGTFGVDRSISRAEMSKILILDSSYKLLKPTKCFVDVNFDDWFSAHVCSLKAYGIANGYANNNFKPNAPITKAEALKLILKSQKVELSSNVASSSVNMNSQDWFYDLVNFAVENQIWFFDNAVSPNSLISRGEFAQLFYNNHNFIEAEKSSSDSNDNQNLDLNNDSSQDLEINTDLNQIDTPDLDENLTQDSDGQVTANPNSEVPKVQVEEPQNNNQNSQDSNVLNDLNFKEYAVDSFDEIRLDHKFANFYFDNQIFSFSGRLDTQDDKVLFAVLDQSKNTIFSQLYDVENSQFDFSVNLDLEGEYFFALIPGTGGSSKIYEVTFGSLDDFTILNNGRDELNVNLQTDFVNYKTFLELNSDSPALYELSFKQNNKEQILLVDSNQNFEFNYSTLKGFVPGEILVKAAKMELDYDSLEILKFNQVDLGNLDAVYHNFSEINSDISNLSIPSFFTKNQAVNVGFTYADSFKKDFYLIQPNGIVKSFKDQISSNSNNHTLSFLPDTDGTYILEINDNNGLAIINVPIYQSNSTVLLPDYFDLFDRDNLGQLVDTNLMLNLINEARANYGLSAVELNTKLNNLSKVHLDDMIDRDFFAHVNLDGQSPQDRASLLEINTVVGENLAKDLNTEKAFHSLMRSAVHRANILNPEWETVGLAIAESDGYVYVVQEFSFTEESVVKTFDDLVSSKLNLDTLSQNLQVRASQWSDLMIENDSFSTNINNESIFDTLLNSGFTSFSALVGAQSDLANLETNLENSLDRLKSFAATAYGLGIAFDGEGKFAFTIIVAK